MRFHPILALTALVTATACAFPGEPGEARATAMHAPRAETDEAPSFLLTLDTAAGERTLGSGTVALPLADGGVLTVDEQRRLLLHRGTGSAARVLLDAVIGAPALLPDGRLIAARATDIGESDLWLLELDDALSGVPPRALAAAPGADGQPFSLDDGRVLFVSDRTGVAAVYLIDADGTRLRQLTNQRARPGALGDDFIPPPLSWLAFDEARVRYDAGDRVVALDLASGRAEVSR